MAFNRIRLMFINFTEDMVLQVVEQTAKDTASNLQANHIWNDITGTMTRNIGVFTSGDEVILKIDVPYGTFVDYWKPFISELESDLEQVCVNAIENLWENSI